MVYKLSLEQLNDIVKDAVINVIGKLDDIEIVDDSSSEKLKIKVEDFSEKQYQEAIQTMMDNRKK